MSRKKVISVIDEATPVEALTRPRILPPSDPLPPPMLPMPPTGSPAVMEFCKLLAEILEEELSRDAESATMAAGTRSC